MSDKAEFKLHGQFALASRDELSIENQDGVPIPVTWTGNDTFEVDRQFAEMVTVRKRSGGPL